MAPHNLKFARLAEIETETSSEKRRALLREVTDMFLGRADDGVSQAERNAAVDHIFSAVVSDFADQVRQELAEKIAASSAPLRQTALRLAKDQIAIARPILERSRVLIESDLLEVVHTQSQDHLLAVTRRNDVGETLSYALVARGDDTVVVSLLENNRAKIGATTYEAIADRAQDSAVLHAPFIRRAGVPPALLNEIYFKVEKSLRREIVSQYANISPEELKLALAQSRRRLAKAYSGIPEDMEGAQDRIDGMARRRELDPAMMLRLLREGKQSRTAFMLAFAKLADVEFGLSQKVIEAADLDALALLCRAAEIERALFVSLAIAIVGSEQRLAKADEFGALYGSISIATAKRAVRFWKVRASETLRPEGRAA